MQSSAAVLVEDRINKTHRQPRAQIESGMTSRCENWAQCYRDRMRQGHAQSFEGTSRSTRGNEVEWSIKCPLSGKWLGFGVPKSSVARDWADAEEINGAWQSIPDAYHQAILGGWYVRKWSPQKCSQIARKVAGLDERTRVTDNEFERIVEVAHGLLSVQLSLPAVFRRVHLALRVRTALELDEWIRLESGLVVDA